MENERSIRRTEISQGQWINIKRFFLEKLRRSLKYMGPAFVVSVAYIDPGNFAANISAGSKFNYSLLWVILFSNLMAIFLQIMSAKLGIATGRNLPEMCSVVFSKRANCVFWVIAELGAMVTNLAEFLGAALGMYLLFNIPMIYAGIITAVITLFICGMEKYGQKIVERIIIALVTVICAAYLLELFLTRPDWSQVCINAVIPIMPGGEALLIAVGMLGATIMPHVIYLHSELVQYKNTDISDKGKAEYLKMEKIDIAVAMNIAFLVNASIVIVSASVFYSNNIIVDTISQAHNSLEPLLGSLSSVAFGIALLISGLSSSVVGTLAGQTIMKGFVNLNIPPNVRRIITIIPALIIISLGVNTMHALLISQVILSFTLPLPIIQMLIISGKEKFMGCLVNNRIVSIAGAIIAAFIILLNTALIYLSF